MGLSETGDQIRHLLSTAGRSLNKADPGSALLRRVNVVLMVFDDRLYHLDSGHWVNFDDSAGHASGAARMADAAATLLAHPDVSNNLPGTQSANQDVPASILLLLPPADFLVTPVVLPGVAPDAIRPALQLQSDSLLPGYDDALSVAVKATEKTDASDTAEPFVAFWLPTMMVNALHNAFADQSLFLTAIMPRPALLAGRQGATVIDDRDSGNQALLLCRGGVVSQCLQTRLADLDTEAFQHQWQKETAALTAAAPAPTTLHSADDYLRAMRQHGGDARHQAGTAYAIVPAAALAARHQFDKGKRLWRAAAVLAAITVIGTLPFLVQSIQLRSLTSTLAEQEQLAAPARANQLAVRDFESRWGVLTEYPRQDVPAMLLALQEVVSPNVLSALELEAGYISIEGESIDPQGLLQQLEMNPMFTEVDFARATSNNRYYIDLRLTTVNFPAYHEWYFPEAQ